MNTEVEKIKSDYITENLTKDLSIQKAFECVKSAAVITDIKPTAPKKTTTKKSADTTEKKTETKKTTTKKAPAKTAAKKTTNKDAE